MDPSLILQILLCSLSSVFSCVPTQSTPFPSAGRYAPVFHSALTYTPPDDDLPLTHDRSALAFNESVVDSNDTAAGDTVDDRHEIASELTPPATLTHSLLAAIGPMIANRDPSLMHWLNTLSTIARNPREIDNTTVSTDTVIPAPNETVTLPNTTVTKDTAIPAPNEPTTVTLPKATVSTDTVIPEPNDTVTPPKTTLTKDTVITAPNGTVTHLKTTVSTDTVIPAPNDPTTVIPTTVTTTTTTTTTTVAPTDCCPELMQTRTMSEFPDGMMNFTYNNNACRSTTTALCTQTDPAFDLYAAIVANGDQFLEYLPNTVTFPGTCTGGTWFMGSPPLPIVTLECRLTNPPPTGG